MCPLVDVATNALTASIGKVPLVNDVGVTDAAGGGADCCDPVAGQNDGVNRGNVDPIQSKEPPPIGADNVPLLVTIGSELGDAKKSELIGTEAGQSGDDEADDRIEPFALNSPAVCFMATKEG